MNDESAAETPTETLAAAEPGVPNGKERRRHRRFAVDGRAQVCLPHGGLLVSGRISDISNGGCFIESPRIRLEKGTLVEIFFETKRLNFRVMGNITALRQGVGVGITFLHPTFKIARQIRELISELEMDTRME